MEQKSLEKTLNYLDVVQLIHSHDGWDGQYAEGIPRSTIAEVRRFFDYLQLLVPMSDIPEIEDVYPNEIGGISISWETNLDLEKIEYDSFEVTIEGNAAVSCKSKMESLGTTEKEYFNLNPKLHEIIIRYMKFFKREQDGQRKI